MLGAAVEHPHQTLFPVRPVLVAGTHAIRERQKHEGVEVFSVSNDASEFLGGRGIIEVSRLRHFRHQVVRIHKRDQHAAAIGGELEASGDLVRQESAGFFVVAGVGGFSHIVEENGEVEDSGVLEFLENLTIAAEFR